MDNCTHSDATPSISEDDREQLNNGGEVGPINRVQLPANQITRVWGVLLDVDPAYCKPGSLIPDVPLAPGKFYEQVAKPWLTRHPTLAKAEVRDSGGGLHVILRADPPIEIRSERERLFWQSTIPILQSALPSDPQAPGITATTRAIGSKNSKHGRVVSQLHPGEACSGEELIQLSKEIGAGPFKFLLQILAGSDRISPCPICGVAGSELNALSHFGECYAKCGKVTLDQLMGEVMHNVA